ncbi:MAG: hypothetical protein IMZ69_04500 [Spirochaetes bacterium]|nr:hypothetical protein [Spirochaetota bacterium]
MNNNRATLENLEKMGMWGMMRALRLSMEAGSKADLNPDELVSHPVDCEWDERENRRLTRLVKLARFRYRACVDARVLVTLAAADRSAGMTDLSRTLF